MAGKETHAAAALALVGGGAVAVAVAGGLVTLPLARSGLTLPFFTAIGVVGVLGFATAGARLRRPVAWALPVFWVGFWAWAPAALTRTPDPAAGTLELTRLLSCTALSMAVLGCTRGSPPGLRGMRLGWFAGLACSVSIASWELLSGNHLWATPARPHPFGTTPVGTYINPNNFACALVSMIAGSLALAAGLHSVWARRVVYVVTILGGVVVLLTQSRSGLLALTVVAALEFHRRLGQRRAGGPSGLRAWWAALTARGRTAVRALAAALLLGVVAAFAAVALAARTPLTPMLVGQVGNETLRSDSLRLQLLAAAWRYLRESGWLGTGAGSFEHLLWSDPAPGTIKLTNLHNAFMELLTQYGVHIGVLFALAVGVITWCLVPTGANTSSRATRYEGIDHLTAMLALGIAASSALHVMTWWVMLAAAAACAWEGSPRRRALGP